MRLAVISDTHSNGVAFRAVIRDLKEQSPDRVIFLGDALLRGPQPAECLEMLYQLNPILSIRGNHDHLFTRFPEPGWKPETRKEELSLLSFEYESQWISLADQEWLGHLPLEKKMVLDGIQIECYHAAPDSLVKQIYPWASLEELDHLHKEEETKLILYGHIHHSYVRSARGRLVVNPGSIGLPFDGDSRASYAIIDIDNMNISAQIRRVTYDLDQAIGIAKDRAMPFADVFEYALKEAHYPYNNLSLVTR